MRNAYSDDQVSVVLPTHNRPELLREALESISNQTFPNWTTIVVDDASEPPVSVKADPRVNVIRNDISRGGAGSKNTGVFNSNSDIIAFLDDDDLLAPTYLERAVAFLSANPSIDVVFMGVSWFGERGKTGQAAYDLAMKSTLGRLSPSPTHDGAFIFDQSELFNALLHTVPMAFQRPVVRRNAFLKIGGYQTDILLWDCDWAIRAALHKPCALIPDGLYLQRAQGQGFSSQQNRQAEHIRANALMKSRLFVKESLTSEQSITVKMALKDVWFEAAWSSYQQKDNKSALRYLLNSAKIKPSLTQFRMLVRILLSYLSSTR